MEKKIVHYTGSPYPVGDRMVVVPCDHPDVINVSNRREAMTSPLVRGMDENGEFETKNTIYRKLS